MAESSWQQLYDEVKSGVVAGIPEGTYRVQVDGVRVLAPSRLLFLDFKVLDGPSAGSIAQVNLYVPEAGNRNAGFHFRNKIAGFGDLSETFRAMDSADDVAGALGILAASLEGRIVDAELELRSDGEYAGTNQLVKTKPVDSPVPAPAAAAAPAPAEDEVAELKRKLAEAEAATAPIPAEAMTGEVPF